MTRREKRGKKREKKNIYEIMEKKKTPKTITTHLG
jgi:hypothetical protein